MDIELEVNSTKRDNKLKHKKITEVQLIIGKNTVLLRISFM